MPSQEELTEGHQTSPTTVGIWDLAKSMRLRARVAASATTYFRKFYTRSSFSSWDPQLIHVGCLYLAGKAEESSVAASYMVRVMHCVRGGIEFVWVGVGEWIYTCGCGCGCACVSAGVGVCEGACVCVCACVHGCMRVYASMQCVPAEGTRAHPHVVSAVP